MSIQDRKLLIIEQLLNIQDESFITKLELLFKIKSQHDEPLKPMKIEELYEMIEKAKKDKKDGKVTSHPELKKRIKSWK